MHTKPRHGPSNERVEKPIDVTQLRAVNIPRGGSEFILFFLVGPRFYDGSEWKSDRSGQEIEMQWLNAVEHSQPIIERTSDVGLMPYRRLAKGASADLINQFPSCLRLLRRPSCSGNTLTL